MGVCTRAVRALRNKNNQWGGLAGVAVRTAILLAIAMVRDGRGGAIATVTLAVAMRVHARRSASCLLASSCLLIAGSRTGSGRLGWQLTAVCVDGACGRSACRRTPSQLQRI